MNSRKQLLPAALFTAAAFLIIVAVLLGVQETSDLSGPERTNFSAEKSTAFRAAAIPPTVPLAERRKMSDSDLLRWLEQRREVPEDADDKDWDLCSRTSWWGKPLDPKTFWQGKVLWCDELANSGAARHGRAWPPIPYDDAELARLYPHVARAYPNEGKEVWSQPGFEGRRMSRGSVMTSKESAFWVEFIRTQPKPPESIASQQVRAAELTFKFQSLADDPAARIRVSTEEVTRIRDRRIGQELAQGYPAEAFSPDALFWGYVFHQRQQYQRLSDSDHSIDSPQAKGLFDRTMVDRKYITEALTEEQLRHANAWKISYLQRLRREKTDESYISAYLKAWNLTPADVFGDAKAD